MKLSDISSLKLSPGTYRVVASYDGDDSLNPVETYYVLVVNEREVTTRRGRSVTDDNEDGQKPYIVKRDPKFYFSQATVHIDEAVQGSYTFEFIPYLVNEDGVGYNIMLSEGLTLESSSIVTWYDSGTYTISLTSNPTDVFNAKTIVLTLNVVSKANPQIEYHNDGTYVLDEGVLVKKYYNIEKRDGVYKFDLMQPSNPFSLPLEYKIEGKGNCYVDAQNNKVYVSQEGKYKITAIFTGNETYRPSITSYILSYYETIENEQQDTQGNLFAKVSPNLSFSSTVVRRELSGTGTYTGLKVNNPYGVSGIWTTSNNANITADGSIISFNGTGNVIVYYTFYGNEYYTSQSVSYVLDVYIEENPDNKPIPNVYFQNNMVEVVENEQHEYHIQQAANPDAVNINYYCNGVKIEGNILHTDSLGRFTIVAQTEEDDHFFSMSTSYELVISAYEKTKPTIWFLTDNETVNQTSNHEYLIQEANTNIDVPITYTVSSGSLNDRVLSYSGSGKVIITATTQETFYYESSTASYVLEIIEVNKLSPEIMFLDGWGKATNIYVNQSQSNTYDILPLSNPHNVQVRFYTDRGTVDNETNATKLYLTDDVQKDGTVTIYAQSIEDDTYKSEIATYKLVISNTISLDLLFNGDKHTYGYSTTITIYAQGRLDVPVNVELLRFDKDDNFNFIPSEWYISDNGIFSRFDGFVYSEEDNQCVVSGRFVFSSYRTSYYKFYFKGNDEYNKSPEVNLNIVFSNSQRSPEISFPSNIDIVTQSSDYDYVLQNVENPHDVEIVYSSSKGVITDNILHYEDIYNVVITATSVETDEYYSDTIRYTLQIKPLEKVSRGWHFAPSSSVPVPISQDGKYVVLDILDANDNIVPANTLSGQFSCSKNATFEYDDELGKYVLTLANPQDAFQYSSSTGVYYFNVNFKMFETGEYKAETISYKQYVKKKPLANISFDNSLVNVNQTEDGRYALQTLNNPDNHPIVWSCTGGYFDDNDNPRYVYIDGVSNAKIYATVQETDQVSQTQAMYGLYVIKVTQRTLDWTVMWKDEYSYTPGDEHELNGRVDVNETGVYDLWEMIDITGIDYENVDFECSGPNCTVTDNRYLHVSSNPKQQIEIRLWADETFYTLRTFYRLWLLVKYPQQRNLFDRVSYSAELIGSVNEEFEIEFARWPEDPEFEFKEEEWSHSSQGYGTIKNIHTKTVNEYTVLCGTFSTSMLNWYINGRITFKGNETFYSNYISYDIYVNKKEEPQDTRIVPQVSFDTYTVKVKQNSANQYLLQTLNKPDDCDIDRWEIVSSTYGTPTILDDTYVYFVIDDTMRQVTLRVFTKESDIYKPTSITYTLQVSPITKQNPRIRFTYESKTANKNDNHTYELPQLENPYSLPVTWSTTLGTVENGYLVYDGVGTATLTVTFDGDDTYEAATTSCTYKINNQYDKQYITYQKYGDREVQVIFGQEYSFEVLRWPISIGLEFNAADWRYSTSSLTCSILGLESEDDGDYRILKARYIFDKAGSAYVSVNFNGNDYFYSQNHIADYSIYYTRAADLVSPNISFADSSVTMPYSSTTKYLIQTPDAAAGVTFNEPTTSLGYIDKVGDDYYVVYDGTEGANITISISNVQDSTYYSQTVSYTLNVEAKPIEVQDTQISFANSEETKDYVWENNKVKKYKLQTLYNPWGLNIVYSLSAGSLRQESDGYYVYYDSVGDITINAAGQSNQYYNGSTASYTLHVVSVGEDFSMTFEQPTITVTQTSEGRYLMQQAIIVPEVPDIRNNIVYSAVGATIEAAGDDFYIVYNGIGNLRVKALFESDLHYKSKEAYYTLTIEENIEIVDPDISISSNNIQVENITEQTSFKVPYVTNNSGVEYNWYIGNTQFVVDANGYFNYNATGDFVIYLETVGTQHYNSIKLYCNYTNIEYIDQYFTVESLEDNNIIQLNYPRESYQDDVNIEYSTNLSTWNQLSFKGTISLCTLNADDKVYLKGTMVGYHGIYNLEDEKDGGFILTTKKFNVSGNIMSLLYGDNFRNINSIEYPFKNHEAAFQGLFAGAINLINAGHLILPTTTLLYGGHCYHNMFNGCTSLVNAPELPATTLAQGCYSGMFYGCTSLVSAPELPATEAIGSCYANMFNGCTSLVNAPELPATTLGNWCYSGMFGGCTSLVNAPELPATNVGENKATNIIGCYANMFNGCTSLVNAPELPALVLGYSCYNSMFAGCTSLVNAPELPATILYNGNSCYAGMFAGCTSLVNAPELPATTLKQYCYHAMFYGCTSLVNAPELPATTLVEYCYNDMFMGCRLLANIKCLATDISASDCLTNWLNGVPSSGTFTKKSSVEYPVGESGIPQGWTVVNV